MTWKLSNFADGALIQAIDDDDTAMFVSTAVAALLPTLSVGDKAKGVLFNATYAEIVNITDIDVSGELTIERGQENTTARAWAAGTKFTHTPTAEVLQAILDATVTQAYRGTASGTNAITVTGSGAVPTPSNGDEITFEIANANTDEVTISYTNGASTIGPYDLVYQDSSQLRAGELLAGWHVKVRYDSSEGVFKLITQSSRDYRIDQINTGPLSAGNLLPNGDFSAWNNNTTFSTPASGTETADNVVVSYDGSIGTFSISRQPFDMGQTSVPGGPKYFLRWDHSSAGSASSYRRLRMKVPQVGKLALETVIASFYAKADVSRSVTAKLIQSFGTGGSPSAEVVVETETWNLTTSWQRFDLTDLLPSLVGKTLGSGGDDGLILELSLPINTSMTIDFAMGQLEFGNLATLAHSRFPTPWWNGGVGGSFDNAADFLSTYWPQLSALNALVSNGFITRTGSSAYAARQLTTASAAGLTITNPAGAAADPIINLSTGLVEYAQDPMSVAELASVTGVFGTAAFVADNTLVHLAGAETITGLKRFEQALATDIVRLGNTTNTSLMAPRWTDATTFEFVPSPSGVADATKGFGYDVTNARWFVDTNLVISGQALHANGTAALPSIASLNDPNTGFYFNADDTIRIATNGAARWYFNSNGDLQVAQSARQIFAGDSASATAPAYSFNGDTNMGLYRIAADNLGITLNGALQVDFSTSRMLLSSGIDAVINSATGPSSVTSLGFRGVPNIAGAKSGNYTSVLTDAGAIIEYTATATHTIPPNSSVAYPIGTVIMIASLNGGGNVTVHPDTGVTLRRGDAIAGTGDRIIAADSAAFIRKKDTNEWYIYGLFT